MVQGTQFYTVRNKLELGHFLARLDVGQLISVGGRNMATCVCVSFLSVTVFIYVSSLTVLYIALF